VVPTASSHHPAMSPQAVKIPSPDASWHLERSAARDKAGATHPSARWQRRSFAACSPPIPALPQDAACPPPSAGTASTPQDYLLLVFAPVSLCSGTRIPSILPLPGPAARSRSQRGILAVGVRHPARGAPALPPSLCQVNPNARAGLAQCGDTQRVPGVWGQRGRCVLRGAPSLHLQHADLGGLWEEGLLGTGSTWHLIPAGAGRNWAHRCLASSATPGTGVPCPSPPAPQSHTTAGSRLGLAEPSLGSQLLAEVPVPRCRPGLWDAAPLTAPPDAWLPHAGLPWHAAPGTGRGRDAGTAVTALGRPRTGTGARCSVLRKSRPLDGIWEPQNAGMACAVPAGLRRGQCLPASLSTG